MGAVDCVGKPSAYEPDAFEILTLKVKSAAQARLKRTGVNVSARVAPSSSRYVPDGKLVAIGASTGGVEALLTIFSQYPANCPPTVVTLHMPAQFTKTFAQRVNRDCAASVVEATHGAAIEVGKSISLLEETAIWKFPASQACNADCALVIPLTAIAHRLTLFSCPRRLQPVLAR